jgi:hypothetical protein
MGFDSLWIGDICISSTVLSAISGRLRARHLRGAVLLPRVSWSLARPAPVDRSLEGPAKNQNDENEKGAQYNDLPLGDGASRADTRGHPDTGCCGQVALANKMARIAFAILRGKTTYCAALV